MTFPSEAKFQEACASFLERQENIGHLTFFHVPNGGNRNVIEATKFKRMGVRAGVPDLVILSPKGNALFIELKNGKKGKLSDNQIVWKNRLRNFGFDWFVIDNFGDFVDTISQWVDHEST